MEKRDYIKLWENKGKRAAFLNDYKSWGVWLTVPELELVYYRYELPEGSKIFVMEYQQIRFCPRDNEPIYYTESRKYLQRDDKFMPNQVSENFIIEYLLELKVEYQKGAKTV